MLFIFIVLRLQMSFRQIRKGKLKKYILTAKIGISYFLSRRIEFSWEIAQKSFLQMLAT